MIESSPEEMLDSIVKISSPQSCAEIASVLNRLFESFAARRGQDPKSSPAFEFVLRAHRCTIAFSEAPPFVAPVALGNVRLYIDPIGQPASLYRPSLRKLDEFRPGGSVLVELNETSFVRLTDEQTYLAASFPLHRGGHWVRVENNGQPWRFSTKEEILRELERRKASDKS